MLRNIRPFESLSSEGLAINEAGVIAGYAQTFAGAEFAFVYDGVTETVLPGIAGSSSRAVDIDDRGHVVGYGRPNVFPATDRGFLWVGTERIDLTEQLVPGSGYTITRGLRIRDDGTILAVARIGNRDALVLLEPTTPLPPIEAHATGVHPLTATVTSPNPGPIVVTEVETPDAPPPGSLSTYVGTQLDIEAPTASAAAPLTITLDIDASILTLAEPDLSLETLTVFRDGVPVPACTEDPEDAAATPNPCVTSRELLTGVLHAGDVRVTILTSAASSWTVGIAPTAPDAPRLPIAVRGDRQATIDWYGPLHDGFRPITGYTVTSIPGGRTATVDGTTYRATVTGLTNGTSYTFTVTATNVVGTGRASDVSNAVTPVTLPSQTVTFTKSRSQDPSHAVLHGAGDRLVRPAGQPGIEHRVGLLGLQHDDPVVGGRNLHGDRDPARLRGLPACQPGDPVVPGQPGDPDDHVRDHRDQDPAADAADRRADGELQPAGDPHLERIDDLQRDRVRGRASHPGHLFPHGQPRGRHRLSCSDLHHSHVHRVNKASQSIASPTQAQRRCWHRQ